jgi:hypothetical protein
MRICSRQRQEIVSIAGYKYEIVFGSIGQHLSIRGIYWQKFAQSEHRVPFQTQYVTDALRNIVIQKKIHCRESAI